jgi:hypothetical protein
VFRALRIPKPPSTGVDAWALAPEYREGSSPAYPATSSAIGGPLGPGGFLRAANRPKYSTAGAGYVGDLADAGISALVAGGFVRFLAREEHGG